MRKPHQTAVLIDGTALYFRTKQERGERLDYAALDRHLRQKSGAEAFQPAIFFTSFDPANEGQTKFHNFLRTQLGWRTEESPVWEADPALKDAPGDRSERHNEFIRFDAPISFALGRLVESRSRIVVLTDSYGVQSSMTAASTYGNVKVTLAFFGRQLDPRWLSVFRRSNNPVEFWDLDDASAELFGREEISAEMLGSALSHLR
ncbi:MAG: hypothetical protein HZA24_10185 [Nitrospirae bacterium]|nr:hypothetical protein [Nitrospirota bacterium]